MPESLVSGLFLACFLGIPPLMLVLGAVQLWRLLFGPTSVSALRRAAAERGWRDTRVPSQDTFRFEGQVNGTAFVLSQRRKRLPGPRRAPKPVEVTLPSAPTPGLFVVQPPLPGFLGGGGDRLVSARVTEVASLLVDPRATTLVEDLRRLPGTDAASPYAAWATDPGHPLAPAADALVRLLASRSAELGAVLVGVHAGELKLRVLRPRGALASLVDLAAECHRIVAANAAA